MVTSGSDTGAVTNYRGLRWLANERVEERRCPERVLQTYRHPETCSENVFLREAERKSEEVHSLINSTGEL